MKNPTLKRLLNFMLFFLDCSKSALLGLPVQVLPPESHLSTKLQFLSKHSVCDNTVFIKKNKTHAQSSKMQLHCFGLALITDIFL